MPDVIVVDTDVLIDAGHGISEAVACLEQIEQRATWQSAASHKWNSSSVAVKTELGPSHALLAELRAIRERDRIEARKGVDGNGNGARTVCD